MTDDGHDEDEEFPNKFENPDQEEDPLSDIALRRALLKSYLQMEDGLKAMGYKATLPPLLPKIPQGALNAQDIDSGAMKPEDTQPTLHFFASDLESFTEHRKEGLAPKSLYWVERSSKTLWESTNGEISQRTMVSLRESVLDNYKSADSHSKLLGFATAFLRFLARTKLEPRYTSFAIYLERSRAVKEKKRVTGRIVTKEDIANVLAYIRNAEKNGKISSRRAQNYAAFVTFGAYTGQRSMATVAKLTVGQFREALKLEKPVLLVESSQDKIRMTHWVPIAPQVVKAVGPLLGGRQDDELMFRYSSFWMWAKRQKIPMSQFDGHFQLGDMRKFAEQYGDVIQWDQSNRAYILTHGVSGVSWSHYRNPLPENVYDIYMKYWENVDFAV